MDVRLTIPAQSPYRELAVDLAVKFAEYAGASSPGVHAAVEHALAAITSGTVEIEMARHDRELVLTTTPPSDWHARFPLPD